MRLTRIGSFGALMVLLACASSAMAGTSIWYAFSEAAVSPRSAMAEFDFGDNSLVLTLTNRATAAALDNTEVLTAVFFTLRDSQEFSPDSAIMYSGSQVLIDNLPINPQPVGGVVGGEWAYKTGLLTLGNEGISSSGFGLFGDDNFPGANLAKDVALDGSQYGIVGPGGVGLRDDGTGLDGLRGEPFIQNSVVFTLFLAGGVDYEANLLSNVYFQYGTGLDEPRLLAATTIIPPVGGTPIPEPLTMASALLAIGGLGGYIRRRMKSSAK